MAGSDVRVYLCKQEEKVVQVRWGIWGGSSRHADGDGLDDQYEDVGIDQDVRCSLGHVENGNQRVLKNTSIFCCHLAYRLRINCKKKKRLLKILVARKLTSKQGPTIRK